MSLIDRVASSRRLRDQMRDTIRRSRTEGVEMGFPICANGNGAEAGEREMTRGDDHSTQIVLSCPITKGELLGTFHTHVNGPRYPSRHDILDMAYKDPHVVCTGQGDTATCIAPKSGVGPKEIQATVEEINFFSSPFLLAPEFRYMDAVKKNFDVKEISL